MTNLHGICTPVCTVFTEDGARIDSSGYERHIEGLLKAGVHIIAPAGGTGEFSFMSGEERRRALEIAHGRIAGRARTIAHVSAVRTEETIELSRHAEGLGVDALLVLPPYFEGPTLDGVYEHYERVAAAVTTPIMAYNIPAHTGIDLTPEFCQRLMKIPHVDYLKDSTGDFTRLQDLVEHGIAVFVGGEPIMFHALLAGARGCFWGTSNAIAPDTVRLYELVSEGQFEQAAKLWRRLYPLNRFVWGHPFNPSVKAATNIAGGAVGNCRRPVQPLSDAELVNLKSLVGRIGRPTDDP